MKRSRAAWRLPRPWQRHGGNVCLQAGRRARTAGEEEVKALGQKHVMSTQGKWRGVEIKNKITAGQAKSVCVRGSLLPTMWHRDPDKAPKCGSLGVGEGQPQHSSIIS